MVARLGDDKVDVVGRGSNLRRASAYSGLLREGIRGLRDGNSLHNTVAVRVSLDDSLARCLGALTTTCACHTVLCMYHARLQWLRMQVTCMSIYHICMYPYE